MSSTTLTPHEITQRARRAVTEYQRFANLYSVDDLAVRCDDCKTQNITPDDFYLLKTVSGTRIYYCTPCLCELLEEIEAEVA